MHPFSSARLYISTYRRKPLHFRLPDDNPKPFAKAGPIRMRGSLPRATADRFGHRSPKHRCFECHNYLRLSFFLQTHCRETSAKTDTTVFRSPPSGPVAERPYRSCSRSATPDGPPTGFIPRWDGEERVRCQTDGRNARFGQVIITMNDRMRRPQIVDGRFQAVPIDGIRCPAGHGSPKRIPCLKAITSGFRFRENGKIHGRCHPASPSRKSDAVSDFPVPRSLPSDASADLLPAAQRTTKDDLSDGTPVSRTKIPNFTRTHKDNIINKLQNRPTFERKNNCPKSKKTPEKIWRNDFSPYICNVKNEIATLTETLKQKHFVRDKFIIVLRK